MLVTESFVFCYLRVGSVLCFWVALFVGVIAVLVFGEMGMVRVLGRWTRVLVGGVRSGSIGVRVVEGGRGLYFVEM